MSNDKSAAGKKTTDKDVSKGGDLGKTAPPASETSSASGAPPASETSSASGAPPASETPPASGAPPASVELGPTPIRKINPKDIMEKKMKEVEIPKGGMTDLFTLIGTAANLREGESTFGPWVALVGEFEACRLSDGQRFISTQAFIPGAAGDLLVAQVRKFVIEEIPPKSPEEFKKIGKTFKVTGETVEMALVVSVKEAARDGGANYEYVIRPVVPVQKSDPLKALRDRMMATLPRLAAPKTAALPAPETKTA